MTHKVEVDILDINWPICRPDLSVPACCVDWRGSFVLAAVEGSLVLDGSLRLLKVRL